MQVNQKSVFIETFLGVVKAVSRSVVPCLGIAILFGHSSSVSADTILYQTGFEAPAYSLGNLAGQDSWSPLAVLTPVVQSATTFSGSQAAHFNATGLTGQTIVGRPITYNALGNPESIVRFTMRAMITSAATTSNWNIFSISSSAGFLAQTLVVQSRNARISGGGAATGSIFIQPDVWNQYEMNVDFANQWATAYVNGEFIGQRPLSVNPATNITRVAFGVNSLPGTDSIFYDDLLVMSIPEPGSMALLSCGAMPLLWRRRR
jgi:hypothetical protein